MATPDRTHAQMSDEGFHEIQLNGKQLVFLFMAATVVSVVIFLCGVMVGRGVRDRTAATAAAAETAVGANAAEAPGTGDAATRSTEPAPTNGATQPSDAAVSPPADQTPPPPAEEDADYYDSLVKERSDAKLAPPARADRTSAKTPAAAKSPAATATTVPAAPAVADRGPTASGYAVQLVAVRERGEADAIAKRLVSKGYQAYVLVPQPGKPPVYRVQVGRFTTRGDADKIATRLRKEEQFKPWVTR